MPEEHRPVVAAISSPCLCGRHWGGGRIPAKATLCRSRGEALHGSRLLCQAGQPRHFHSASPTHQACAALFPTDIKIWSDKLSATAAMGSDIDFSNCLDRPRHKANLFLSPVIADAGLMRGGPAACGDTEQHLKQGLRL